MNKKTNFIYIITDQHRADYLGCYGHPIVKTPTIDRLAQQGSRFENFHVASPVCMPNRASLLTGRIPSVHGLRKNGLYLSDKNVTFADVLRKGGYHTAMIGKSHVQPFTGLASPLDNPFKTRDIPEAVTPDDQDWLQEDPSRWSGEDSFNVKTPYYGFDHVDMVTLHGDRCGGHYYGWLKEKVGDPSQVRGVEHQLPHDYICPQAYRSKIPEELHPTTYIKEQAIDYIQSRQDDEQPFFAFVSFPDPHHPFSPPGKYWEMYDPEDFSVDNPYSAHKNPPPHLSAVKALYDQGVRNTKTTKAFMSSEQEIKEAMALTCGMITMIDDAIAEIVATLAATGQDEDTVIIINSDHGDYMGDYNLLLKGPEPSRAITRVPFIWYDPHNKTPEVINNVASTIDVAPTIIARAGLQEYNGIQGSNLMPVLNGERSNRSSVLIEFEDNVVQWGFEEPCHSRTLVSEEYRLTIFAGHEWGELYHLGSDIRESHNLWDSGEHQAIKNKLITELLHKLVLSGERSPWPSYIG